MKSYTYYWYFLRKAYCFQIIPPYPHNIQLYTYISVRIQNTDLLPDCMQGICCNYISKHHRPALQALFIVSHSVCCLIIIKFLC